MFALVAVANALRPLLDVELQGLDVCANATRGGVDVYDVKTKHEWWISPFMLGGESRELRRRWFEERPIVSHRMDWYWPALADKYYDQENGFSVLVDNKG